MCIVVDYMQNGADSHCETAPEIIEGLTDIRTLLSSPKEWEPKPKR